MRRVIVSEFVSLDGVMEDPSGAGKTWHGGWTLPYWNEEIGKFKFDELFASDALLLGRITYQGFAKAIKDKLKLKLLKTRTFSSGNVLLCYQPELALSKTAT
jgi:dihydrofolate reductase